MADLYFSGSRLFLPIATTFGLRIDQVNFAFCQACALTFAFFYRRAVVSKQTCYLLRVLLPAIGGIFLVYFCFGNSVKHVIFNACVCYLFLTVFSRRYVHWAVLVFSMAYLSFIHWHKINFAQSYVLDISGPLMVFTQKVTSLAFSLHDGISDDDHKTSKLTLYQKRDCIRNVPSFLEYMSYIFTWQTVLCGPFCSFNDYINFIKLSHIESIAKKQIVTNCNNNKVTHLDCDQIEVYRKRTVVYKLVLASVCMFISVTLSSVLPATKIVDGTWFTFLDRFCYLMVSLFVIRCQYYFAWTISEAVCIESGFGFSGLHPVSGLPEWDLLSNVNIIQFEFGRSFRETVEAWNIGTSLWLRRTCYERVPAPYNVVATYALSAWWHGFYPGYYATFATGALFTQAARVVRRNLRPVFQGSSKMRLFYDCLTLVTSRFAITYAAFPFVLLHLKPTWEAYESFFFFLHIAALGVLLVDWLCACHRNRTAKATPNTH